MHGRNRLEVDALYYPAEGRPTHLHKSGGSKDASASDMELSCEADGGADERAADPAASEALASDQTGRGPDNVLGLVLRSARPGDSLLAGTIVTGSLVGAAVLS
jgi:hypothetical protein